jgi:putative transcriptional regulator
MTTLQGHLLVAPPQEPDPDFARAVILLIQHCEQQAFGVVLNRPDGTALRQVWRGKCRRGDDLLYSGGPVPGPLIALHADRPFGEIEVFPGVFYSVKQKSLKGLFETEGRPLKVFQSHVGWGPGQLDQFLANGPWRTMPAAAEHVFDTTSDLWDRVSALVSA